MTVAFECRANSALLRSGEISGITMSANRVGGALHTVLGLVYGIMLGAALGMEVSAMPAGKRVTVFAICESRAVTDPERMREICTRFRDVLAEFAADAAILAAPGPSAPAGEASVRLEWEPIGRIGLKARIVIHKEGARHEGPLLELTVMDAPLKGAIIDDFLRNVLRASEDIIRAARVFEIKK